MELSPKKQNDFLSLNSVLSASQLAASEKTEVENALSKLNFVRESIGQLELTEASRLGAAQVLEEVVDTFQKHTEEQDPSCTP
ncbi:hypothetical protein [Marinibactrum halimedae]|uniref:Uncharacterized protein n=1 Tax=Marinibactrum halimedae TaxID=1444977 RepID=A0AA37T3B6_9GAMM|nr:hypothetical protein [Marinibactrum halimedae]MCD9458479.1 hypothetical protein [Marinibactrum halimedae]GLS26174.1 hypothetical protein GCM10007877_18890 [Marinibactrum halimedae]